VVVATLSFAGATSPTQVTGPQARSEFAAAFEVVQSANLAGATNAELSNLTLRMNAALRLMDNADILDKEGRSQDGARLRAEAISFLDTIPTQATNLQAKAEQRTSQERVLAYLLAPILAGLVVVAYHYGRRGYKRYRVARMMYMGVKVKSDANKK
jgi:hypothetical protein